MGADTDVHLAAGQPVKNSLLLFGRAEPTQHLDSDREGAESLAEGEEVLLGEHGGRHQHGYLLVVHYRLEGGTDGYLRLAVTDIAADQPVHRPGFFHVHLYLCLCIHLVGCFHIGEGGLKLLLPHRVRGKGKARHDLPGGVES